MNISEGLATRINCRAFLSTQVSESTVRSILNAARQSPSSGNHQPWHAYILSGQPLQALMEDVISDRWSGLGRKSARILSGTSHQLRGTEIPSLSDSLPKNVSGDILKRELRRQHAELANTN